MKYPSLEKAIEFYYSKPELTTEDVQALFDCSKTKACKLKKSAQQAMAKQNVTTFQTHAVDTKTAYTAWNINIEDYEQRKRMLIERRELYTVDNGSASTDTRPAC